MQYVLTKMHYAVFSSRILHNFLEGNQPHATEVILEVVLKVVPNVTPEVVPEIITE